MGNSKKQKKNKEQPNKLGPLFYQQLKEQTKEYHVGLIFAVILATLGSITSILGPDRLSEITDLITAGLFSTIDVAQISRISLTLAVLYAIGALMSYFQGFVMATITQRFSEKLRSNINDKINRIPLRYFDAHSQGETLSRVTNDLDTVGQSLNQSLGSLVPAITLFIGCLIMMIRTNILLTVTAVLSVLLGFLIMVLILMKSQKHFESQQAHLAEINGFVEEAYSGHQVIISYNAKEAMHRQFQGFNQQQYTSIWKSQFLSGIMQPLMGFIGNFGYVTVCVVGSILALNDQISFGVIVAFMVYVRLFSQPLSQLAQSMSSLQLAAAAMARVFDFLREEEMSNEQGKLQVEARTVGEVTFDHVSFGYTKDKEIIHDFSVVAHAGEKIAIVGPTGAGKTTIVNLLMKFYDIDSGTILIDDVSIQDLSRAQVHNQFCMVLQDTWLFEGTIKDNLRFNQTDISDDQIQAACKAAGIDHFISTLPQGYDTVLNDSLTLSAGQKQLLTIARALLKDAPMLILDEATSSVDTRTEEVIQKAMDKLMVGRTSFVIAHRLSTIKNADLILVMKEGEIIEQGSHDALMAQQSFYADLYNSQFEKQRATGMDEDQLALT